MSHQSVGRFVRNEMARRHGGEDRVRAALSRKRRNNEVLTDHAVLAP